MFVVYVDFASESPVNEGMERAFNAAFRPGNEASCAWRAEGSDEVLRVSFDLDASDYEEAAALARIEVERAARVAAIEGRVVESIASTEEGQVRWTADG